MKSKKIKQRFRKIDLDFSGLNLCFNFVKSRNKKRKAND